MCMTMVGVDAVQTLPHGPDQPTESVRGGGGMPATLAAGCGKCG